MGTLVEILTALKAIEEDAGLTSFKSVPESVSADDLPAVIHPLPTGTCERQTNAFYELDHKIETVLLAAPSDVGLEDAIAEAEAWVDTYIQMMINHADIGGTCKACVVSEHSVEIMEHGSVNYAGVRFTIIAACLMAKTE